MRIDRFLTAQKEVQDILIAVLALTFSFSIANFVHSGFHLSAYKALYIVGVSLLAVCLAFILHEMAHRQLARKYGGFAEFRIWPLGLIFSLLISFLGFVAAAPGAVYMNGVYGPERVGKTALGGPATNIALGTVFMAAAIIGSPFQTFSAIAATLSQINLYLATFNLIPFPPLDGQKVLAWDFRIFAIWFAVSIFLTVFSFVIFG